MEVPLAGSNDKVVKAKNNSKKLARQACKNVPEGFIRASDLGDSNFSSKSFKSQEDHSVSKVNDKMETEVEKDEISEFVKIKKNLESKMIVYEDHEVFSLPIWDMDSNCNIFATIEVVEDCLEIPEEVCQNTGYIFAEHIPFRSSYCQFILPGKSSGHEMVEFPVKFRAEKLMLC